VCVYVRFKKQHLKEVWRSKAFTWLWVWSLLGFHLKLKILVGVGVGSHSSMYWSNGGYSIGVVWRFDVSAPTMYVAFLT